MPNSINRRRISTTAADAAEVAALKEQLEALRQLYVGDMANVSNDMRILSDQLNQVVVPFTETAAPVGDPPVEETVPSLDGVTEINTLMPNDQRFSD